MGESMILRLLVFCIITLSVPVTGVMKCPKGIRSYGAYPDDVNDPSYYYDCSKTRIAVLKKCKPGQFYDMEKSNCAMFPERFRSSSRSIGKSSFRKSGSSSRQGAAKAGGKAGPGAPNYLSTDITPAEMKAFMQTRMISEQLKVPALGRPIRLGAMVYGDEDRIAYDENLWKESTLTKNATIMENPSSSFKIRETNNILDKYNLFNIEGTLKLEMMSGKLQVSFS